MKVNTIRKEKRRFPSSEYKGKDPLPESNPPLKKKRRRLSKEEKNLRDNKAFIKLFPHHANLPQGELRRARTMWYCLKDITTISNAVRQNFIEWQSKRQVGHLERKNKLASLFAHIEKIRGKIRCSITGEPVRICTKRLGASEGDTFETINQSNITFRNTAGVLTLRASLWDTFRKCGKPLYFKSYLLSTRKSGTRTYHKGWEALKLDAIKAYTKLYTKASCGRKIYQI
jgi:hypothetical protein